MTGTTLQLAAAALLLPAALSAQAPPVATYSAQTNLPQWNQDLGVVYTRQGCSGDPAACLHFTGNVAQANNVKVTLIIPFNNKTTADYALQYSQLSLNAPFLFEISFDDFVDQYRALFKDPAVKPADLLAQVLTNLKSANPNLKFGATIYEDDLDGIFLQDGKLPASLRAQFDSIHLYLHFRENGPNFPGYVAQAQQIFPNANVVAGAYAYDRRAFRPCSPGGVTCTEQQDIDLFKQALTIQVQQVRAGAVDHIEFFPGYFGVEETWPSWTNPHECDSAQIPACIANTKTMREAALSILTAPSDKPVWTPLAPTGKRPLQRYGHSAAVDPGSHRMMLFGGHSATAPLNDTWILTNADGQHGPSAWLPVHVPVAPPAAPYSPGMYDPESNRMIVYGGPTGTEVWVLSNANGLGTEAPSWIKLIAAGPLPALHSRKPLYDPRRNVLSVAGTTPLAGAWELSHANGLGGTPEWTHIALLLPRNEATPSVPPPDGRTGYSEVYDSSSLTLIVCGGRNLIEPLNSVLVLSPVM